MPNRAIATELRSRSSQIDSFMNKLSKGRNFIEEKTKILYYVGLIIVIVNRVVDQVSSNLGFPALENFPWMPIALAVLCVRCICVFCDRKVPCWHFIIFLIFLILSMISYSRSGQSYLPSAVLLLYGIGRIDIKQALKYIAITIFAFILFLGLLQLLVWLKFGELPGSVLRDGGRLRLSFFFQHPNMLAAVACMSYMSLSVSWVTISVKKIAFGFLLGLSVLLITDSKTSTALLFLSLILRIAIERNFKHFKRVFAVMYYAVPLILFGFVILILMQVLPDYLYKLFNAVFTGRPGFWILQYEQLGHWTLFGQQSLCGDIVINGFLHKSVTIDSFYAATVLQLGAWAFFAFYFLYVNVGRLAFGKCAHAKHISNEAFNELAFRTVVLFCCALFGATEIHMIDFAICTPMLLLGDNLVLSSNAVVKQSL